MNRYLFASLAAAAVFAAAGPVRAQSMTEASAETRFQLDLQVPQAALAPYLPEGWTSNIATTGPAKDANLRMIFVDRVTINDASGKPVGKGSNRLVYLAAPVKDPAGTAVQLIIGGLTEDPSDAPGPFGNYLLATTATMQRSSTSSGKGPILDSQDWVFTAPTGEHLEMHIKYERGIGNRNNPTQTRFYSSKTPTFYQVSMQEQVLDIVRNVTTTPPDRVKEFSLKATGGSYAPLFNGTEKVLSWDNILWFNRAILVP